ncbi:MAG TPA: MBL fold metallo-hydrolase, partial [Halomonas sp.]|nr:MBL fold metallo-hydrolase [Halomonas sp.]
MNKFPRISHHGGASGVTGSCHRLQISDDRALLVDCGLFQGQDADHIDSFEQLKVHFPVDDLLSLVVTHVHIDHIGRLPYLLAAGYSGPILCSLPTARLLPLVIEDALKIGFTRDRALIERFLAEVEGRLVPLAYREWHTLVDDSRHRVRVKLQRAGHILGSCYVEVDVLDRENGAAQHIGEPPHSQRTLFSGDLGAPYAPLLPAPRSPWGCDTLVLESTYGDRLHENRRQRRGRLKAAIDRALANGGTVVIPAFSIGRTQELLYEMETLIYRAGSRRWRELEIIVDSPLAARFTEVYRELKPWWDAEAHARLRAGRHPLSFENLYTVSSHREHEQTVAYLAESHRPAVVIAASGMVSGGRVVNYLKRMLGDPRH